MPSPDTILCPCITPHSSESTPDVKFFRFPGLYCRQAVRLPSIWPSWTQWWKWYESERPSSRGGVDLEAVEGESL